MTDVLGLHRTVSRVSIDSIASFAGSINTKKAYKEFCKNLYQIGVTAEMIRVKESEILDIFKPHDTPISAQTDDSNIAILSQFPAVSYCSSPGCFLFFIS